MAITVSEKIVCRIMKEEHLIVPTKHTKNTVHIKAKSLQWQTI